MRKFLDYETGDIVGYDDLQKEYEELKAAWAVNSLQANECRPLDWMETTCPELWLIDGEEVRYNWYEDAGVASFHP